MLQSLYIKNYRRLKELKIDSLGRVNLIAGRNNTGKSTLLEAIALYAKKGLSTLIYQLLENRGENVGQIEAGSNKNLTDIHMKILSSLFTDRAAGFDADNAIVIEDGDDSLTLRFVKYIDETHTDEQGNTIKRRRFLQHDEEMQYENYSIGFQVQTGHAGYIISLENGKPFNSGFRETGEISNLQFIGTKNMDKNSNGNLFDRIALTKKEQYVIEALKIIEPSTERIAFIEETPKERSAVIKLSDDLQQILPLQSMGDGINRILTVILALVNADNGFLLIDEFENGMHYTVQEQLWKIIFTLSQKLNVQVFVTTHSEDCIRGFETVLNASDDMFAGKMIRLDNKNGTIKPVIFNSGELKIASSQNIELR
jgi:AAA15 family ATPase/GTPase